PPSSSADKGPVTHPLLAWLEREDRAHLNQAGWRPSVAVGEVEALVEVDAVAQVAVGDGAGPPAAVPGGIGRRGELLDAGLARLPQGAEGVQASLLVDAHPAGGLD